MAGFPALCRLLPFSLAVLLCLATSCHFNKIDGHRQCTEGIPGVEYLCMELNLSRLPDEIPATAQLLDLSFNSLGVLSSRYFARLPSLRSLDLTRCSIEVIEDEAFWGLQNLTSLFLTGNPLNYVSEGAFHCLLSLQKLAAVEMNLPSLDHLHIGNLTTLQELNVGHNKIKSLKIPLFFTRLQNLRVLNFHSNMISDIYVDDLSMLKEIDTLNLTLILSGNIISFIEPDAFRGIRVNKLSLRRGFSSTDSMKRGLHGLAGLWVRELELGCFRGRSQLNFANGLLDGLCWVDFQEILLINFKYFPNGTDTMFDCLINATVIRVVNTRLKEVTEMSIFKRLLHLEFKVSYLTNFPYYQLSYLNTLKVLKITNGQYFINFYGRLDRHSNLVSLDLSQNKLNMNSCCMFMETGSLQHLNLSFNLHIEMTSAFLPMFNLRTLDLHHTELGNLGGFPVFFNLSKLWYLDVSHTKTTFIIDCPFCGLENLQVLKVAGTIFSGNSLLLTFRNLTKLVYLDISTCRLGYVPSDTFSRLLNLQELHISNNNLMYFDPAVYLPLKSLLFLDISKNQILALKDDARETLPGNLISLDLSLNPFDCSCIHLGFILWVKDQKKLLQNEELVLCKSPTYLSEEKVSQVDTSYCSTTILTVMVTVGLLSALILIVFIVYKCYFRHWYILVLMRWCMDTTEREEMYDAFVIYSSKDEEWVTGELVKKLEEGVPPFRLCLHFRDFMPGVSIASNIVQEGFLRSRKAIVVVSAHFMESRWCSFEFELAQSWQFLESKSGIIVVVLQEVDKARLRQIFGLHRYLRRNTYLEWKENPLQQHLFWVLMRKALLNGKPWQIQSIANT